MNSPKRPMPLHSSALMEIGLILLVVTLIINVFARLLIWKVTKGQKGGASNMQNLSLRHCKNYTATAAMLLATLSS